MADSGGDGVEGWKGGVVCGFGGGFLGGDWWFVSWGL